MSKTAADGKNSIRAIKGPIAPRNLLNFSMFSSFSRDRGVISREIMDMIYS